MQNSLTVVTILDHSTVKVSCFAFSMPTTLLKLSFVFRVVLIDSDPFTILLARNKVTFICPPRAVLTFPSPLAHSVKFSILELAFLITTVKKGYFAKTIEFSFFKCAFDTFSRRQNQYPLAAWLRRKDISLVYSPFWVCREVYYSFFL